MTTYTTPQTTLSVSVAESETKELVSYTSVLSCRINVARTTTAADGESLLHVRSTECGGRKV